MKDKRTLFFENMQALEFSLYYMKHWNMIEEAEHLYYRMVATLMSAYANDELTGHEYLIFDDYLSNVYNELFK